MGQKTFTIQERIIMGFCYGSECFSLDRTSGCWIPCWSISLIPQRIRPKSHSGVGLRHIDLETPLKKKLESVKLIQLPCCSISLDPQRIRPNPTLDRVNFLSQIRGDFSHRSGKTIKRKRRGIYRINTMHSTIWSHSQAGFPKSGLSSSAAASQ